MMANAPDDHSELAEIKQPFRIVEKVELDSPLASEISESSQYSVPLESEVCISETSVICGSVDSMGSVNSMASMYTWENLALAAKAEKEAKKSLSPQIRKWYNEWIDHVYEADATKWQNQISDMIGKHLMHATGKENTLALVMAFHDLNTSKFASISREGFIASAEEIMMRELASWTEALPSGEADYYQQLPAPHQEAFRICRSLTLRALEKTGTPTFFLGGHELAKRISISDREAGRILNKSPFLKCVERGKPWQTGTKPQASCWQWIYPLG
ncbi:MAG: hypothetical protein KGQ87_04120 [Verrucomicrobia bacterium]|nr:hypothetical protein [Verrucomicrobiota bacterium]